MPVYSKIISCIKFIKHTELKKLDNEYKTALAIAQKDKFTKIQIEEID